MTWQAMVLDVHVALILQQVHQNIYTEQWYQLVGVGAIWSDIKFN